MTCFRTPSTRLPSSWKIAWMTRMHIMRTLCKSTLSRLFFKPVESEGDSSNSKTASSASKPRITARTILSTSSSSSGLKCLSPTLT